MPLTTGVIPFCSNNYYKVFEEGILAHTFYLSILYQHFSKIKVWTLF